METEDDLTAKKIEEDWQAKKLKFANDPAALDCAREERPDRMANAHLDKTLQVYLWMKKESISMNI